MEEYNVKKSFKFLNFWVKYPQFNNTIQKTWTVDFVGNSFSEFHEKLKKVKISLIEWSKKTYGNIFERINTLEDIIGA